MSPRRDDPRLAAAALVLGLVATASYAAQRLYGALSGVEAGVVVIAQAHVFYYWRVDVALLHGLVAAVVVGFGLREPEAAAVVRHGAWLVPLVVAPAAISMVLVP